jgi:transposase
MEAAMNVVAHHSLEQLQASYRVEKDGRRARRLQGIYLARMGRTCPEIMAVTGSARRTIQQWVAKYNRGGLDELFDRPRPGQPTKLPRDREAEFCRRIDGEPRPTDGLCVLNGPAIQRLLEREFGCIYTLAGVHDLLHRLGYSYLCPRPRHEQADPQAQDDFKKTSPTCWTRSRPATPANASKSGSRMKPASASKVR